MRSVAFGLVALVLIALGWSALWSYAAGEAETRLTGWMAAEHAEGRNWTCPQRRIGGYPFSITIRCAEPRFEGVSGDRVVRAGVAGIEAEAALTHPSRIDVALMGPLTYKTTDGTVALAATWLSLVAQLDGLPNLQAFSLHGTNIDVSGAFPDANRQGGAAGRIDARFTKGAQPASADFTIAIENASLPPLDDLLGNQAPASVSLVGRIDHADVEAGATPDETLEHWRQAGGRIALSPSSLSHSGASLSATGALGLDDAHRPQGRLQASFVGLEPLLKRYGINGNLAAAGSLLNNLFGSKTPQSEPPVPGSITLPISLNGGRLGIGPIRTAVELPRLY